MENNKCCENGDCEKCKGSKGGMCCGYKCWGRKCHLLKIIVIVFVLIIVFCLGVRWGEIRSETRGYRYNMMNWLGYNKFENKDLTGLQKQTGEVTVKVLPKTTTQ